jgi:D-aminopeptidase
MAFAWKGGIGTASRRVPARLGGWTVGVLVQSNFGGVLTINGAPVGQALGQYYLKGDLGDGSVIIVVATDAPLDHRQLLRVGRRALAGLARTGSSMTNGSGDYVIAFSTASSGGRTVGRSGDVTGRPADRLTDTLEVVTNDAVSPLFEATIEATEEAIYNSLLRAETVRGYRGTAPALPLDSTVAILKRYGVIRP